MTQQQKAQLLPGLFEHIDKEQRFTVLHLGPVLPETLDFFSSYRCKIYVADLFTELPFSLDPVEELTVEQRLAAALDIPAEARFDLCLFWDLFNYLQPEVITALMGLLRPHWYRHTRAHAFSVHNTRTPQQGVTFSMSSADTLTLRPRASRLPGYAPLPQSRLKELLVGLEVQRSVLLAESRLELLLGAHS